MTDDEDGCLWMMMKMWVLVCVVVDVFDAVCNVMCDVVCGGGVWWCE